jgi:hypothetical protein
MSKLEDTAYNYGAEVGTRKPRRIAELEAENDRLREALKGLVGLVQLVRSRDDCPIAIKQALTDHYRLDDAFEALTKEAGQ